MENELRPAERLVGLDLKGRWHVDSIMQRHPKSTGGNFSVGYLVINSDGRQAYLKALDFTAAFQHPDLARALQDLTTAYNFERDLLEKCKNRKLRRVVVPLDSGSVIVPGVIGELRNVLYLILELATGDIRNEVAKWQKFDVAWALRSLHQSALGLQELHYSHIAHQDLKPSNVLVFPMVGSKLSDMGQASYMGTPSRNDLIPIAGEISYAAPEQFHGLHISSDFTSRFIVDNYHLGSLMFFFFLGCSVTSAISLNLSKKHHKEFTNVDFANDLPYIQQAFYEALDELRSSVKVITEEFSEDIVTIAKQLCEPDPKLRGAPSVLAAEHIPQYDLQPFISHFNRLAKTAEIRMI